VGHQLQRGWGVEEHRWNLHRVQRRGGVGGDRVWCVVVSGCGVRGRGMRLVGGVVRGQYGDWRWGLGVAWGAAAALAVAPLASAALAVVLGVARCSPAAGGNVVPAALMVCC